MCGPGLRRNGQDEDFSGDFLEVTSPHSCKAADLNNAQRALTPPTITVDFVLGKTGDLFRSHSQEKPSPPRDCKAGKVAGRPL
jgi:hypothetical protein